MKFWPRTPPVRLFRRRPVRRPWLEQLEDRVTPSATLNIDTIGQTLTFTGSNVNNNLGLIGTASQYTFASSAETISLTGNTAGWSVTPFGSGSKASGPTVGFTTIDFVTAGGSDNVTLGASTVANLGFLAANVNLSLGSSTNTLTVFDLGGTLAQEGSAITIGSSTITGIAGPGGTPTINYTGSNYSQLHVSGSISPTVPENYVVANPSAPLLLDTNAGADTVTVTGLSFNSTVNGTSGNHTFVVDPPVVGLDTIAANLTINAGTGSNALTIDDSGSTAGEANVVVSATSVTGLGNHGIAVNYKAIGGSFNRGITLKGSSAGVNNYTINSTLSGSNTTILGEGGDNNYTITSSTLVNVTLDGGAGTNSVTGPNATNSWAITSTNAGTLNGTNAVFSNIQNLTGGGGSDSFVFTSSGVLSGNLDGSGGSDTLVGDNTGRTFTISGPGSGTVSGILGGTFANIENLTGGSGGDSFLFAGSGHLNGNLDGGTGANSLSYSSYGSAVSVVLSGSGANGFTGSEASSLGGSFQNIGTLTGSSSTDQLTGENVDSTWTLSSTTSYSDVSNTLNFSSFETFQGGSGNDTFNVTPQPTLPWVLDGGAPTTTPGDTLNLFIAALSPPATNPTITSTGIGSGIFTTGNYASVTYSHIESVVPDTSITGDIINATPTSNHFRVVRSGGNEQVYDTTGGNPGILIFNVSYASVNTLTFNGTASGGNQVNVDFSGGNAIPSGGIVFNGAGTGNLLQVTNGTFTTVTSNFAGPNSGNLVFAGLGTITYTGLQPIDLSDSTEANLVFNLATAGTNNVVLEDNGSSTQLRSSNSSFETTSFSSPTSLLTINRGLAADTFTETALPHLGSSLTVGSSGSPFSTASFNGAMNLSGSLNVNAGSITVSAAVAASGAINLTAQTGLTINGTVAAGGAAQLTGGAAGGGSAILLNAAVTGTSVLVNGGAGVDTFTINTSGASAITLDGLGAGDTYIVNFGGLNGTVNLADSGGSGTDSATFNGTAATDTFTVSETQTSVSSQTVTYTTTLEQIAVYGLAGNDTFNVSPSRYAPILIDGGSPSFGGAGIPPGDTLNFNPLGNTFTVSGSTILTNGGVPAFQGVSFNDIETLPFSPAGTTTWDLQMLGSAASPLQTGYTGVLPTRLYGTGTLGQDYGWLTTLPTGGYDRGAGAVTGTYANLLRGGQYGSQGVSQARTFQADVTNGYYMVSIKLGDTRNSGSMTVTNADTSQVVESNLTTSAGQFMEQTFVINVTDGTMDLSFSDLTTGTGSGQFWLLNGIDIRPAVLLTEGFPPAGPFAADGVNIDTFTLQGATPNAEVTVSTTMGTITSPDVDAYIAGVQLLTDNNGQAAIKILRSTGGGQAYVTTEEVSGAKTGLGIVTYTLPNTRRIDFNAPGSPTESPSVPTTVGGFIGVQATDTYNAARGFGWISAVGAFDRGAISGTTDSDLLRDGAFGSSGAGGAGTFRVDLPNGTYQVTVIQGDLTHAYSGINVAVVVGTGTGISNLTTTVGQFSVNSFTVTVNSGQMALQFSTTGTSWVVNGLEIRPAATVVNVTFTNGPGLVEANGTTVDTITGHAAVPDGTILTITTSLGTIFNDHNTTYAGSQAVVNGGTFTFQIQRPIAAGIPTLTAAALDGTAQGTDSSGTVISYKPASVRRVDFLGGNYSPPSNFFGVASSSIYSSSLGDGWLASVQAYDRGSAPGKTTVNLYRGGAFNNGSTPGTFRVQVAPGTSYNLRLYFYDATHAWSNIQVTIGASSQSIASLAAGQTGILLFTNIAAPGNGLLDVVFSSTGFAWISNGLDIWATTATDPGQAPQLASGGEGPNSADVASLTQGELASVVPEAVAHWEALGLAPSALAELNQVHFQIANLGGNGVLGLTGLGSTIVTIDATAAGYGWFVDPTPGDDSEFGQAVGAAEKDALGASPATGRMDLLTVVEHELGHVLGLDDVDAQVVPHDLMTQTLATGVRRLPVALDLTGDPALQVGMDVSSLSNAPALAPEVEAPQALDALFIQAGASTGKGGTAAATEGDRRTTGGLDALFITQADRSQNFDSVVLNSSGSLAAVSATPHLEQAIVPTAAPSPMATNSGSVHRKPAPKGEQFDPFATLGDVADH